MLQFIRDRILPSKPARLVIQTAIKWQQDKCAVMGAALSYYALFSLFPILLIVFSVIGGLIGPETDLFAQIQDMVARFLPSEARDLVRGTLVELNRSSVGAGIIGTAILLYTGSTVFSILTQSVDVIWRVHPDQDEAIPLRQSITTFAINRFVGFVLVFSIAFLLLISMASNIVVRGLIQAVDRFQAQLSWVNLNNIQLAEGLQIGTSLFILAIATLLLLKVLPSTHVAWRDVWPGALLTAVLLIALQRLVSGSVISIGSHYASYGVIGGVMILMLWIYFTSQIFFIGCVFSYVFAYLFGSRRNQSTDGGRRRTLV